MQWPSAFDLSRADFAWNVVTTPPAKPATPRPRAVRPTGICHPGGAGVSGGGSGVSCPGALPPGEAGMIGGGAGGWFDLSFSAGISIDCVLPAPSAVNVLSHVSL